MGKKLKSNVLLIDGGSAGLQLSRGREELELEIKVILLYSCSYQVTVTVHNVNVYSSLLLLVSVSISYVDTFTTLSRKNLLRCFNIFVSSVTVLGFNSSYMVIILLPFPLCHYLFCYFSSQNNSCRGAVVQSAVVTPVRCLKVALPVGNVVPILHVMSASVPTFLLQNAPLLIVFAVR